MEPESSLPYSQVPATSPYPEPTPSSPHNPLPQEYSYNYSIITHILLFKLWNFNQTLYDFLNFGLISTYCNCNSCFHYPEDEWPKRVGDYYVTKVRSFTEMHLLVFF